LQHFLNVFNFLINDQFTLIIRREANVFIHTQT
jgi:hypothetical protein